MSAHFLRWGLKLVLGWRRVGFGCHGWSCWWAGLWCVWCSSLRWSLSFCLGSLLLGHLILSLDPRCVVRVFCSHFQAVLTYPGGPRFHGGVHRFGWVHPLVYSGLYLDWGGGSVGLWFVVSPRGCWWFCPSESILCRSVCAFSLLLSVVSSGRQWCPRVLCFLVSFAFSFRCVEGCNLLFLLFFFPGWWLVMGFLFLALALCSFVPVLLVWWVVQGGFLVRCPDLSWCFLVQILSCDFVYMVTYFPGQSLPVPCFG